MANTGFSACRFHPGLAPRLDGAAPLSAACLTWRYAKRICGRLMDARLKLGDRPRLDSPFFEFPFELYIPQKRAHGPR